MTRLPLSYAHRDGHEFWREAPWCDHLHSFARMNIHVLRFSSWRCIVTDPELTPPMHGIHPTHAIPPPRVSPQMIGEAVVRNVLHAAEGADGGSKAPSRRLRPTLGDQSLSAIVKRFLDWCKSSRQTREHVLAQRCNTDDWQQENSIACECPR